MFNKNKYLTGETLLEIPTPSLKQCLAKTYKNKNDQVVRGHDVLTHCTIVGKVARELIARLPGYLQTALFPPGSELIAAAHDWGKISPTFQKKLLKSLGVVPNELLHVDETLESNWGGHAGVSQAAAQCLKAGRFIPEILGQHHGITPTLNGKQATAPIFGGHGWQTLREDMMEHLKCALNTDWPEVESPLQARVLAGLTTVSDWIGSGSFFENPADMWAANVTRALDDAGFISPKLNADLSFNDVFKWPPRLAQRQLIESVTQPGVYILEAPMGLGKTEAALYAAYQCLQKQQATGIYFALPTQLTSDSIHSRVNLFLQTILAPDCVHKQALLMHSNAWLKTTEMGEEGKPGGDWFLPRKRSILAPFAVGTVDQALMAVMNVKHGFVRTFGLAGKVVILDEVHSYDAFTGTLLDELVSALRQLHCTVIILSATLTNDRKASLLGVQTRSNAYPLITAYPNGTASPMALEVASKTAVNRREHNQADHNEQHVAIRFATQRQCLDDAMVRAAQGQQVLWVENTVSQSQVIFSILSARCIDLGIEPGLIHSRFTGAKRQQNEAYWVKLLGKNNNKERRLRGRILVGTQVLEQSLDIDADFLIIRFCPSDMLLQRIGRLWRHKTTVRPKEARPETSIMAPELDEALSNPDVAFSLENNTGAKTDKRVSNSARVYHPYVLCRSLAVWRKKTAIRLPADIRALIETTYHQRQEHGELARLKHELIHGNKQKHWPGVSALKRMAQTGLSTAGTTLPDENTSTRYAPQDTVPVLLLKKIEKQSGSTVVRLTLLNDNVLTLKANIKVNNKRHWRALAVQLHEQMVNVAEYHAPDAIAKTRIRYLGDYVYLGRPDEDLAIVRVVIVNPDSTLQPLDGSVANEKYQLFYDARFGYRSVELAGD